MASCPGWDGVGWFLCLSSFYRISRSPKAHTRPRQSSRCYSPQLGTDLTCPLSSHPGSVSAWRPGAGSQKCLCGLRSASLTSPHTCSHWFLAAAPLHSTLTGLLPAVLCPLWPGLFLLGWSLPEMILLVCFLVHCLPPSAGEPRTQDTFHPPLQLWHLERELVASVC